MKTNTFLLFRALTNIGNNQLYSISSRNSVHSLKQQVRQISQSSSSSAIPNIHEVHQEKVQPKIVVANPNHVLKEEIHKILSFGNEQTETSYILSNNGDIHEISKYYFDGRGKGIRPRICLTLAEAVNFHLFGADNPSVVEEVMTKQQRIAQISEMYHTGSLYHDDVIDKSEERRSQPSVNLIWGSKRSVMSGDYVVSMANKILADLDNDEVTITMCRIIKDLCEGEFQQMAKARKDKKDRWEMYIEKSYNKTASVLANSCRAVSLLATSNITPTKEISDVENSSFLYGKNIGIAFQLMDDWLDFAATAEQLGKPAAADLKLGIATAPVLFAAERFPEMETLISRRFAKEGDVEKAFEMVLRSDGMEETKVLAKKYADAAVHSIKILKESESKQGLYKLLDAVIDRMN